MQGGCFLKILADLVKRQLGLRQKLGGHLFQVLFVVSLSRRIGAVGHAPPGAAQLRDQVMSVPQKIADSQKGTVPQKPKDELARRPDVVAERVFGFEPVKEIADELAAPGKIDMILLRGNHTRPNGEARIKRVHEAVQRVIQMPMLGEQQSLAIEEPIFK